MYKLAPDTAEFKPSRPAPDSDTSEDVPSARPRISDVCFRVCHFLAGNAFIGPLFVAHASERCDQGFATIATDRPGLLFVIPGDDLKKPSASANTGLLHAQLIGRSAFRV
jgi:hypothetical protein